MMMINSSPTTVKNSDTNNINSPSLTLKASANLSLLFNQLNDFSPEQKNDTDQFQTLKFPEKNKSLFLFNQNACSLSKNVDDLENLLNAQIKFLIELQLVKPDLPKKFTDFQYICKIILLNSHQLNQM